MSCLHRAPEAKCPGFFIKCSFSGVGPKQASDEEGLHPSRKSDKNKCHKSEKN
jgi:hypothetical protein